MNSNTKGNSSTFNVIIDRFEGDDRVYGVLEMPDLDHVIIPVDLLPPDAGEGDCIRVTMTLDPEETGKRRDEIIKMQRELMGK